MTSSVHRIVQSFLSGSELSSAFSHFSSLGPTLPVRLWSGPRDVSPGISLLRKGLRASDAKAASASTGQFSRQPAPLFGTLGVYTRAHSIAPLWPRNAVGQKVDEKGSECEGAVPFELEIKVPSWAENGGKKGEVVMP
ncbi:hypothetical protein MRX96_026029 [Rhipicephalus microplus]